MLARSASDAFAITSAAVGPSWPIRMSSGPPSRNEKPRSAWSSCIEETPTSITTPSTAATPCAAQISARLENRSSTRVSRPSDSIDQIESAGNGRPVAVDADDPGSRDIEDRAAIAAGAEGGVDIDAAVAGCEHLDRLAAENGDMARRSRAHAPAPGVFQPAKWKLDANGPIAPQISALRRAFPAEKPRARHDCRSLRPASRPLISGWNLLGCHGISSAKEGLGRPQPGSALHHLVTALSVKKALTDWLQRFSRAFLHGSTNPVMRARTHSVKMRAGTRPPRLRARAR